MDAKVATKGLNAKGLSQQTRHHMAEAKTAAAAAEAAKRSLAAAQRQG
ncbi:hypothetical protein [Streptomyces sp. NBC_01353]|nr:hypothetical protein [Streptomyces sp. NBC_01353]